MISFGTSIFRFSWACLLQMLRVSTEVFCSWTDISVKQDCIVCPEEVVTETDIIDLTQHVVPNRSVPVSRPQLTQYYKTEDNRYVSIPRSSFSFADYLFQRGIECETRSRIQRSLEMRYWKYMEFYSSVISKAFHLMHSDASKNPFIVFYQPSIQQLLFSSRGFIPRSAIQEVVDTVGVYSLVIVPFLSLSEV